MWLLHVRTLKLIHFFEPYPPYMILSHRWSNQEITFQDVQHGTNKSSAGYAKMLRFCRYVKDYGPSIDYVWIDTCCIDKTNSAELSEAINSMYSWYQGAVTCYAYLNDVQRRDDLAHSAWFTRGWTLQELLAPSEVDFLNRDWEMIGTRKSLSKIIHKITGIDTDLLNDKQPDVRRYSVADRMFWASSRRTTRVEDEAYCLLGLFQVNMPLMYGEGKRAFSRLQQQILTQAGDLSIFSWQYGPFDPDLKMLASSPSCFQRPPDLPNRREPLFASVPDYNYTTLQGIVTNDIGIALEVAPQPEYPEVYLLPLCFTVQQGSSSWHAGRTIVLCMALFRTMDNRYYRISVYSDLVVRILPKEYRRGHVRRIVLSRGDLDNEGPQSMSCFLKSRRRFWYGFSVSLEDPLSQRSTLFSNFVKDKTEDSQSLLLPAREFGVAGMVMIEPEVKSTQEGSVDGAKPICIILAFDYLFDIVIIHLELPDFVDNERNMVIDHPVLVNQSLDVKSSSQLMALIEMLRARPEGSSRLNGIEFVTVQRVHVDDYRSHAVRLGGLEIEITGGPRHTQPETYYKDMLFRVTIIVPDESKLSNHSEKLRHLPPVRQERWHIRKYKRTRTDEDDG